MLVCYVVLQKVTLSAVSLHVHPAGVCVLDETFPTCDMFLLSRGISACGFLV